MQYSLDSVDHLNARQFAIAIKRLADSLSYGTDRSPFVGSGTEYAQSRPYQPGDPVKAIDWRVTARTKKYYIKEYESPKRLPVYLLIDTSASMTVSSTSRSKYALAVHIAGGLAMACLDRVSPVAMVGVGQRELRYSPSLSRDRIHQWLHELRHYRVDETTRLNRRLAELGALLYEKSLLIVLSDLHEPEAIPSLKQLAQQHDCVALQLIDPSEDSLQGAGWFRGREAETGREFVSRGRNMGIDQAALTAEMRRGQVDHLQIRTDQPFVQRLRHFFKSRGLLGRGVR
ncbi:MAG: DUF58 domain-containing protein [Planctomycetaceae bacterium]|nr:DUF58 domain-containing protein [Planctomycetaceae bacterium]